MGLLPVGLLCRGPSPVGARFGQGRRGRSRWRQPGQAGVQAVYRPVCLHVAHHTQHQTAWVQQAAVIGRGPVLRQGFHAGLTAQRQQTVGMGLEHGPVEQVERDLGQIVLPVLERQQDFASPFFHLVVREGGFQQRFQEDVEPPVRVRGQKGAGQTQTVATRKAVQRAGERLDRLRECLAGEGPAAARQQAGDEIADAGLAFGLEQHTPERGGLERHDRDAVVLLDQQPHAVVQTVDGDRAGPGAVPRCGTIRGRAGAVGRLLQPAAEGADVVGARHRGVRRPAQNDGVQRRRGKIAARHAPDVFRRHRGEAGQIAAFVIRVGEHRQKVAELAGLALDDFPPVDEIAGQICARTVEFGLRDHLVPVAEEEGEAAFQRGVQLVAFRGRGHDEQAGIGRRVGAGRDPVHEFAFGLQRLDQA